MGKKLSFHGNITKTMEKQGKLPHNKKIDMPSLTTPLFLFHGA